MSLWLIACVLVAAMLPLSTAFADCSVDDSVAVYASRDLGVTSTANAQTKTNDIALGALTATESLLDTVGAAGPGAKSAVNVEKGATGGMELAAASGLANTKRQATAKSSKARVRGPKSAGALSVKGAQLVDKRGKPFQLKGVSTHGLAWFPDYVNDALFHQLRYKWGANTVRLALYTEEYGGYCSGGDKKSLRKLVKKGVRLAAKNDLYAIVDWHVLADGNPLTHVKAAKSFFRKMSLAFKDRNNVVYEICNEPNGGTTWDDIRKYAKRVIPVIRKNDLDAVILVGTPTWSQEIDKAAAKPLPYGNVMYTLHFYAATHKDDLRNRMSAAVQSGLPVFVSEFGICSASGDGSIDEASANAWMTEMNRLKVSWCMWSLCNKAEAASIIKSSCTAHSGFGRDDLTTAGTWLLKALNGSLPKTAATTAGVVARNGEPVLLPAKVEKRFTSGALACKATLSNSWDAGGGKTCYQYDLSITNNGKARSSWKVAVPFSKAIACTNGWCATFKASGRKLVVKSADFNGAIAPGQTVEGIGFQVVAGPGLGIAP